MYLYRYDDGYRWLYLQFQQSRIYFIISELLSKGIDKDDIYRKVYNTYSESRLRLMGYVLSNMVVYSDYNAALISLTKEEQSKFDYKKVTAKGL